MRTILLCTVRLEGILAKCGNYFKVYLYEGHGLTGLKLFPIGEFVVHQCIPLKCRGILHVLP
jgi:hypothetical protein